MKKPVHSPCEIKEIDQRLVSQLISLPSSFFGSTLSPSNIKFKILSMHEAI